MCDDSSWLGLCFHLELSDHDLGWSNVLPGRLGAVTAVGKLVSPVPGETLRMTGNWVQHPVYGKQFRNSFRQLD